MSKTYPWFRSYPQRDRANPKLKLISRAARSLWHDLRGLMHEAEPYGFLLVAGVAPTPDQLADVLGDRAGGDALAPLIAELERFEVFHKSGAGVLFDPELVAMRNQDVQNSINGALGGNPKLKGKGGVNPRDKRGVKPRRQTSFDTQKKNDDDKRAPCGSVGALVVVQDWADADPRWAAVKRELGATRWAYWGAAARLGEASNVLVVRSTFEADKWREHPLAGIVAEHVGEVFIRVEKRAANG